MLILLIKLIVTLLILLKSFFFFKIYKIKNFNSIYLFSLIKKKCSVSKLNVYFAFNIELIEMKNGILYKQKSSMYL